MCIRDRHWGPRVIDLDLLLYGDEIIEEDSLRVPHPELTRRCLLYTSDAADERSSVDLGGRRIIKKKTTRHIG